MYRALREIIDPSPTVAEVEALWAHFGSMCLYCGVRLDPASRLGQLDHLIPSTIGGQNGIGNRVLACGPCNGDERRDSPWEEFLGRMCIDEIERERRKELVLTWQRKCPLPSAQDVELADCLRRAYEKALRVFDEAIEDLRKAKEHIRSRR
jgi:hypothetical protein